MPLETASFVSDLVTTNPASSDGLNQADDHMRLIKAVLKNTFPNFTAAALNSTQAQIDAVSALLVSGVLRGNGAAFPGMIADHAGTTAPTGWLECNGAAVSRTTYADLFTAIGTTWGAGDGSTTFNLPPDRYRRGRTAAAAAVGTLQADQNKTHTHAVTGTTGNENVSHSHNFTPAGTISVSTSSGVNTEYNGAGVVFIQTSGAGSGGFGYLSTPNYGPLPIVSSGSFSGSLGTTTGESVGHTHTVSITSAGGSADGAEARPLSATFMTCIKT